MKKTTAPAVAQDGGDDDARAQKLFALGLELAKKRSEAIEARQQSGIETEWAEDEENYQGIDEQNRKESSAWKTRPAGMLQVEANGSTRSTVFVNITGPYVDSASASMSDMLLPTDDRGWALNPLPVPDLMDLSLGKIPPAILEAAAEMYPPPHPFNPAQGQPQPAMPPGMPAGMPPAPMPGQPPAQPAMPAPHKQSQQEWIAAKVQKAQQMIQLAKGIAKKAERRIESWHVECQYHMEMRDAMDDAARIGTAVIKGPIPVRTRNVIAKEGELDIEEKIQPGSKRVSPWNLYPDGACGENIHNGSYTFERDELSSKQLRDLVGMEGYIESEILQVIKEGAHVAVANPKQQVDGYSKPATDRKWEIWYFHGYLTKEEMEIAGCPCDESMDMSEIPAMITMVNNRVIRASLNPLDTGDFPYDVMPWSKRAGHWAGRGVARQMRTQQKQVNAAWRALMDNAGIASGPMLIFRQGMVTPADGVAEIRPRKVWLLAEDADVRIDAEKAIGTIKVDMMVNELMAIIKEAMQLAEIVTGLPALAQGQQGRAPDTVGGMQLLNNNASVVRRRLARLFDDCITEPHVRRYYRWLLQYGEDDEKGEFVIDARGSSALVQRDMQNQTLAAMGNIVNNPSFGVDPKRWFAEYCKSQHVDPKTLQYTDEEWANLPPPPQPVQLEVAQAVAQGRIQAAQALASASMQEAQLKVKDDADHAAANARLAMAEMNFEAQQNDLDRQLKQALQRNSDQLKLVAQHSAEYIEQMRQSGASAETVAQLKAMLAATAMKLQTEKQLAADARTHEADMSVAGHLVDVHKHSTPPALPPPVQVPGRAANGHQFDQTT